MSFARLTNAARLSIEILCRGVRVDVPGGLPPDTRGIRRTRAGLGSGLELVIPGRRKDHWINAPVHEDFAQNSPLVLTTLDSKPDVDEFEIFDRRDLCGHPIRIPREPAWSDQMTTSGVPMHEIGVLQGTYLGIYVGDVCAFWAGGGYDACHFCTTGKNVGTVEAREKSVADVVETARAAKAENGVTFVHLNAGYGGRDSVRRLVPFVRALKEEVGVLVGVQATPARDLTVYDELHAVGVDHLSFCYEFHDPAHYARLCPGKARVFGQSAYFIALEHCAGLFGRGACSGEIIAGIEPLEATLAAIDWIASIGAFPSVCVFRPTRGSRMEDVPPPDPEDMVKVYRAVWDACRHHLVPVGLAPNIEVSLLLTPDDTRDLFESPSVADRMWRAALTVGRFATRPRFRRRMRARHPEEVTS